MNCFYVQASMDTFMLHHHWQIAAIWNMKIYSKYNLGVAEKTLGRWIVP